MNFLGKGFQQKLEPEQTDSRTKTQTLCIYTINYHAAYAGVNTSSSAMAERPRDASILRGWAFEAKF